jgi:hypothetical protein
VARELSSLRPLRVIRGILTCQTTGRLASLVLLAWMLWRDVLAAMSRVPRPATLNPEPSYRDWRAAAIKALQKLSPLALAGHSRRAPLSPALQN